MRCAQPILLSLTRHLPARGFEIAVVAADATFAAATPAAGARLTAPLRRTGWHGMGATRAALAGIVAAEAPDILPTHDNVPNTIVGLARRRFPLPHAAAASGRWELAAKLRLLCALKRRVAQPRAFPAHVHRDHRPGLLCLPVQRRGGAQHAVERLALLEPRGAQNP